MGIPTIIRAAMLGPNKMLLCVTVMDYKGLEAYVHEYTVNDANGKTHLDWSGGSWSSEQGAIECFDQRFQSQVRR